MSYTGPARKPIRLPLEAYAEPGSVWLVTINVNAKGSRPFADPAVANDVETAFLQRSRHLPVSIEAYCLMPDHFHIVVAIESLDLVRFVGDVKSNTTRAWWRTGGQGVLWHRSFHDHGLRTLADQDATIRYVLANPVRANLVDDWMCYPYSGGRDVRKSP